MKIKRIIDEVPFFKNKEVKIADNIYHNDKYPSCYKVKCEGADFKIRFPSQFNIASVNNEIKALSVLADNKITNIPRIIEHGKTSLEETHYLIETFHSGESLDKIYGDLTFEDWENISSQLFDFLISVQNIKNQCFETFDEVHIKYNNYGKMLSQRIQAHLFKHQAIGLLSDDIVNTIGNRLNGIEKIFTCDPVFLHFDIKPQNIIYDPNKQIVTIIDFEHSRFGDISHELFRGCIAAKRNPYFEQCWSDVCSQLKQMLKIKFSESTNYYYHLFFLVSELTYANSTRNKELVSRYIEQIKALLLKN
ncbi:MAG: phosphotransferase [Treponemataceae bacterium]|nr:phosphotransferase [Treponemataceae bacterium]